MPPLEPRYPTTAGPKYYNVAEAQEKDFTAKYMMMIEFLKEEINKQQNPEEKKNKQKKLGEMNAWKKSKKTRRNSSRKWIKLFNT